jgi:predicted RNA-binding protein with PIN domain
MDADYAPPETVGGTAVLSGTAAASEINSYAADVTAYTHGLGRISLTPAGYAPCKKQEQVAAEIGYDPESDQENSPDSVFCTHGAGYIVKWDQVMEKMHLPSVLAPPEEEPKIQQLAREYERKVATDKELMAIFERTYGPVRRQRPMAPTPKGSSDKPYKGAPRLTGPEYTLVDGYNIIFAWDELRQLAQDSLDLAREQLVNIMRNYQGFRQTPVILVFDAYKVKGNHGSVEKFGGLSVVYTREAETADMYIEKTTHKLEGKHRVRVATSDGLEQMIILGHGALRVPARAFHEEVKLVEKAIREVIEG